ncbi:MAG: DUF3368 domain-containing protein [Deltaproteobacteria bacterium]|nr:DUF3368 domain-containing protein [Deltaproteobacteria bacterium]
MGLLHHFADPVFVPEPVANEILMKGPEDITVKALSNTSWLEVVPAIPVPEKILEWGLGPGESSVLAFAHEHPPMEVIIDDLAARKCADYLNIPVRGTLGIVLASKKRGIIPEARPVMETLIRSGLYLSRPVLDAALKRVGE